MIMINDSVHNTIVNLYIYDLDIFCKKSPIFENTKEIFSTIIKMSDTCYNWFSINNWNSKPSTAARSRDKRTWMDNWGILKSFQNNLSDLRVVMLVFPINIPSASFTSSFLNKPIIYFLKCKDTRDAKYFVWSCVWALVFNYE